MKARNQRGKIVSLQLWPPLLPHAREANNERGRNCLLAVMDASSSSPSSPPDKSYLQDLIEMIRSGFAEDETAGARELRRMAKTNAVNRTCIAEMGAIPLLIKLLASQNPETQTHAVTAIMNLTLRNDANKETVLLCGGVDAIAHVLENGLSLEARENAAATLFSLSTCNAYKAFIGLCNVFEGLIRLLQDGSYRGKKDAAATLYRLSSVSNNRAQAVRAGAVPPLLKLAADPASGLANESLSVLFNLALHPDGRFAIANASGIKILMDLFRIGTENNKEYAASLLLLLCQQEAKYSECALKLGAYEVLTNLSQFGTDKARSRAAKILAYMN